MSVDVLGVIPARAGSKRLPGKNLRLLLGEPLVVHSIRSALTAPSLGRVVVSTDGEEIARVAQTAGAGVVRRPPDLASDDASTEAALLHVVDTLASNGFEDPEYVVTLEPTSPLRTSQLIERCIDLASRTAADSVITVVETKDVFGRFSEDSFEILDDVQPWRLQARRPVYRNSSTVYVTRTSLLRSGGSIVAGNLQAVVVPQDEAVDIDTLFDFLLAETVMRQRLEAS
jgi:N-acylneuraminate cytidylyltransferase